MRNLLQKARLVTFLAESYVPYHSPKEVSDKPSGDLVAKISARGLILNCVNAIRLQVSTSYLR